MKLSTRGEYALRALLVLGLHYSDSVVTVQAVADAQNIPKRFLEQILNDLRSAGVVQSRRGVAGGYRLARRPEHIKLSGVLRDIEGMLAPLGCVSEFFYEKCSCPDEGRCPVRSVMKEVRDAVTEIMDRVTVADLCERWRRAQNEPGSAADYVI
jgi:Rrf2 family protein